MILKYLKSIHKIWTHLRSFSPQHHRINSTHLLQSHTVACIGTVISVHYPSLDHTLCLRLLNRRITSALFLFFHSPKRSWLSLIHFMLPRVAFLGSLLKMICGKRLRCSPQGGPKMVLGRTPRPYHLRGLWLLCSFIHCLVGSVLQGICLHSEYEKSMYMHDVSRAQQAACICNDVLKANIYHCRYLYQTHVDHHWQDGEQVLGHMSCHGLLMISWCSAAKAFGFCIKVWHKKDEMKSWN